MDGAKGTLGSFTTTSYVPLSLQSLRIMMTRHDQDCVSLLELDSSSSLWSPGHDGDQDGRRHGVAQGRTSRPHSATKRPTAVGETGDEGLSVWSPGRRTTGTSSLRGGIRDPRRWWWGGRSRPSRVSLGTGGPPVSRGNGRGMDCGPRRYRAYGNSSRHFSPRWNYTYLYSKGSRRRRKSAWGANLRTSRNHFHQTSTPSFPKSR